MADFDGFDKGAVVDAGVEGIWVDSGGKAYCWTRYGRWERNPIELLVFGL